jgi:hypothetical protein
MMKKPRPQPESLQTIDLASLDGVTGGRISNSGGITPDLANATKSLAETVAALKTAREQADAQKSQQTMGMMQQMMQGRQG